MFVDRLTVRRIIVTVALLLLMTLSGCARPREQATPPLAPRPGVPANQPPAESNGQVALTLAVPLQDRSQYVQAIADFQQLNPTIQVRVASFDELTAQDSDSPDALAQVADVFVHYPYLRTDTSSLIDLSPLLESTDERNDFLPGLLPPPGSPLFGLPMHVQYPVIFYSKAALDAQGIAYPQNDWTLDQFVETATALTIKKDGEIIQWGYIPDQLRYSPLFSTQLDAPLRSERGVRLDAPDVVAAIDWTRELIAVHRVTPWLDHYAAPNVDHPSALEGNPYTLISAGKAAMWQMPHTNYTGIADVGVVAIPHEPGAYSADPIQQGFAISRGTQQPAAAWQLVTYLTKQAPIDYFGDWHVPARRSVLEATRFWDAIPPELALALRYAVEQTTVARVDAESAGYVLDLLTSAIENETMAVNAPIAVAPAPTETAVPTPFSVETRPEQTEQATNDAIVFATDGIFHPMYRAIADEFMRSQAAVSISLELFDATIGAAALSDQLEQANVDCFAANVADIDSNLQLQVLPVDSFFELETAFKPTDFYPGALAMVEYQGHLLGVPGTAIIQHLQYNRQLFEASNLPEPALDWTVEDFLTVTQQLASDAGGTRLYGYADFFNVLFFHSDEIFGVDLVAYDGERHTANLEGLQQILQWNADLVYLYGVKLPATALDLPRLSQLINDGQVAIWTTSDTFVLDGFGEPIRNLDVGSVPLPRVNGIRRPNAISTLRAYFVLADSDARHACWEWIKFLSQHPAQGFRTEIALAHIGASSSQAYIDTVGQEAASIYAASLSDMERDRNVVDSPDWMLPYTFSWVAEAIAQVERDGDVAAAIQNARRKFEQYETCVATANGFESYDIWRACAIATDPALRDTFKE